LIPASEAKEMSKALPQARLKLFERVGHLIPLEDPSEFENSLKDFFSRQVK
jgi:pimeloyl-ACP methyl ester carboxylesterase